jgi:hypothetical protein
VAVAVLAAVAVGIVIGISGHGATPPAHASSRQARLQAASDNLAATWVTQQVTRTAVVSCDEQMCAALKAHGFPSANLHVLGATTGSPQDSTIVIETATIRSYFGSSLADRIAPMVLTTIGSGSALIDIRVVYPGAPGAYQQKLAADQSNRQKIGAGVLGSNEVRTTRLDHAQLAGGDVDARVLLGLTALVAAPSVPVIDILDFGNEATGQSSNVPLRYVDLAEVPKGSHLTGAAYVSAARKIIDSLPNGYRPTQIKTVTLAGGISALRILYSAPTPLGLLGPTG